jgi:hypothetical protein
MHAFSTQRQISLLAAALSLAALVPTALVTSAQVPANSSSQPPTGRRARVKPTPAQTTVEAAPLPPPPPNWPVNDTPTPPSVKWDSSGLRIDAANSSLKQILDDVASATGTRIQGFSQDQRVFGNFGPGQPRDVLSQLLQGSGYNIIMIGDQGTGAPRELVLSGRKTSGPSQPNARPVQDDNEDDSYDNNQIDTQPPQQPQPEPPMRFSPDGAGARTPQQIQQELQQRQQQLLMQQQQIQQQQQTTTPPPN